MIGVGDDDCPSTVVKKTTDKPRTVKRQHTAVSICEIPADRRLRRQRLIFPLIVERAREVQCPIVIGKCSGVAPIAVQI